MLNRLIVVTLATYLALSTVLVRADAVPPGPPEGSEQRLKKKPLLRSGPSTSEEERKTDSTGPAEDAKPADPTDPKPDKPAEEPRADVTPKEKETPAGEKAETPGNEGPLTIYNPNANQRQKPSPEQVRRENEARDAQNAQLAEERAAGHSRPVGESNSAPETAVGPVIDPYLAQRFLAVRQMAEDPRVPAALGNQVITLLLNVDPQFSNVGPIVAQAEKILQDGGAKKLFADVVDAATVTQPGTELTLRRDEKITDRTEKKAYLQDQTLSKVPNELLQAQAQRNIKTGDVNVYITSSGKKETAGKPNPNAGGNPKPLILRTTDEVADELLAGLALRSDDGTGAPPLSEKKIAGARGLASNEAGEPSANGPRVSPPQAPSHSRRIGLMLILTAALGAGWLLLGRLKKKNEKDRSTQEEPTREAKAHPPEAATSATKVVKR